MLQPNTPNTSIDNTLPQRFGFLPSPKASKTCQYEGPNFINGGSM